jgi:hypothetical protein
MPLTRRWFLQALGIGGAAVVAAASATPSAARDTAGCTPLAAPDAAPAAETPVLPTQWTQLESYLRSRRVKPATLARECGYARQHLLRIRMGRVEASGACAVAVTYALRRLTREAVVLTDLFPAEVVAAAWCDRRRIVRTYHPFQHRAARAVFGRRS